MRGACDALGFAGGIHRIAALHRIHRLPPPPPTPRPRTGEILVGGDLNEELMVTTVQQARARGLRLVVVAPIDPQPVAAAFARRVQEASDADAAIVFPTEGGFEAHVIDEFESVQL